MESFEKETQDEKGISAMVRLVGARLDGVEFILDYVQLQFEHSSLTAITWPRVNKGRSMFSFGSPGYCDALCSFIGKEVRHVIVEQGSAIHFDFTNGDVLEISLKPEDRVDPEAAVYTVPKDHIWEVW